LEGAIVSLTDTAVELGVGVTVVLIGASILSNLKGPGLPIPPIAPGLGKPIVLPGGLGYVDPNPFKVNLPGSFKSLDTLNLDIDAWFTNARGLLGLGIIGTYDPTNWAAFRQLMTLNPAPLFLITYDPSTFPTSATAYFNAKSQAYWGASSPVNSGNFS
jgi:hypothetical protein